jgi:hypothetical protein
MSSSCRCPSSVALQGRKKARVYMAVPFDLANISPRC